MTMVDSLVFQSLNEVVNLHTERMAAVEYRIPQIILWLLFVVAAMAMSLTGFSSGYHGRRNLFFTITLAILVASVILVILDLDNPRRGFIRVSQQSMIQLRDNIRADGTADATPTPQPALKTDSREKEVWKSPGKSRDVWKRPEKS